MPPEPSEDWQKKLVSPEKVLKKIKPGMSIFLGTGVAEPRTLVKSLMASEEGNIQDLELVQLVSLGEALDLEKKYERKVRLKTFFTGWAASEATNLTCWSWITTVTAADGRGFGSALMTCCRFRSSGPSVRNGFAGFSWGSVNRGA